jgi:hypothetical protein
MGRTLLVLTCAAVMTGAASAGEPAWKYVADESFRPVLRSFTLSSTRPEELREEVAYRGKTRKYAQLRYGSEDSRRVVVVVDEIGPDEWDLYVDADRNRVIEAKDRVAGTGRERKGRLDVEITRGLEIVHEQRTVLWRLGASRTSIGMATVGYMAGHVQLDDKRIAARRVDGNGNGFFADQADRLWLDLNGDGSWDPITEQFPLVPILALGDRRYSVRGDALGTRLALEPLNAEGRIRLQAGHLDKDVTVVHLHAMLVSEDGSAIDFAGKEAVVVPAGKYAFGAVSIAVSHAGATRPLTFVFSRTGLDDTVRWHELKKDQELVLDPIGKLRFELDIEPAGTTVKPGAMLRVQPQMFTGDGLLINSCAFGESESNTPYGGARSALVKLCGAQHEVLETATSSFA